MPKFLKYNDCWWKWNEDNMRLVNFNGGGFPIDENEDYWLNGNLVEAKNWHELMHKVGYNPFLADEYDNNVWISPDGEYWDGDAHAVAAESICWYLYNPQGIDRIDMDYKPFFDAEDSLISCGWIKASKIFWSLHYVPNMEMNERQAIALQNWCYLHDIKFPEDEIIIRENYWN